MPIVTRPSTHRARARWGRRARTRATALAVVVASLATMLGIAAAAPASAASGTGGTLIVGMTAGNLPSLDTELAGLQGYEGYRFVGNSLYDGLTRFNLLQSTQVPQVIPDLAAVVVVEP